MEVTCGAQHRDLYLSPWGRKAGVQSPPGKRLQPFSSGEYGKLLVLY